MSKELFAACPLTALPSTARMMDAVIQELEKVNAPATRVKYAMEIITCGLVDAVYEIKYRIGACETIVAWIMSIDNLDERRRTFELFYQTIKLDTTHKDFDSCRDHLLALADVVGLPDERRSLCPAPPPNKTLGEQYAEMEVLDGRPEQVEQYHTLLSKIVGIELIFRKWDSAITYLHRIHDIHVRTDTCIKQFEVLFLSEFCPEAYMVAAAELHYLLTLLQQEDQPDIDVMGVLTRMLVQCYIQLGLFEIALDWINHPIIRSKSAWRLTAPLVRRMILCRGFVSTQVILQKKYDSVRPTSRSVEDCLLWINLAQKSVNCGLNAFGREIIRDIHEAASNDASDLFTAEQQCQLLIALGHYYGSPCFPPEKFEVDRTESRCMLAQALQTAQSLQDAPSRKSHILMVARAFAELEFPSEALAVFRRYQSDPDFVVQCYKEIMYAVMSYYDQLSPDERREWGCKQRESWLLLNLYHLRRADRDIRHRIDDLIHFCFDLQGFHAYC